MPGLAIKISNTKIIDNDLLFTNIQLAYVVKNLDFNEKHIKTKNAFFYCLLPKFIKEERLDSFSNSRFIVALDGDYYNQNEINNKYNLNGLSKLETLLFLYKDKGDKFAQYLNGEFVVIIYDSLKNNIIVSNDRYGRRAFFWYKDKNGCYFASEKKGICAISSSKLTIDERGLLEVFLFNHNLFGNTFIKGVKTLTPASVLNISSNNVEHTHYFTWDFNYTENNFDKESRIIEIKGKLEKAIETRISSKERILIWLSGGYDSRALACGIPNKYREKVIAETYGEDNSDEIKIASELADTLGYNWRGQRVNIDYLDVAMLNSWRTEFSIPALDHPIVGNHKSMKKVADYIIQGVPGLNEINSGHLRIGKILATLKPHAYENYFKIYSKSFKQLSLIFNSEYLEYYMNSIKNDFISFFESISELNKLYKWDVFNLTQRQPNYSHMADISENDLFETLHPFTDIDLIQLFTQIPLKNKLFLQITKDFLINSYPEVSNIPFGNGRGIIKGDNNFLNSFLFEFKLNFWKKGGSIIWDKASAVSNCYESIKSIVKDNLNTNQNLKLFLNYSRVFELLDNKELLIRNIRLLDLLITFLYSNNFLLVNDHVEVPVEIMEHYS